MKLHKTPPIFRSFAILLACGVQMAHAHEYDPSALPLADGKVSRAAEQGSVYSCQSRFNPNAPGAQNGGDWLNENNQTFDLTRKPTVDGTVWHTSELYVSVAVDERVITGNALPSHPTGAFPVRSSDDAYRYDRNPNRISEHRFTLRLPLTPEVQEQPSCLPMGAIGISLTGAVFFNALDARGENALAHEILDRCQGHPQRSGLYHYHGMSPCQEDVGDQNHHSMLIGYALDGFGIYGPRGEEGHILNSDELDECHGHVGLVQDERGEENVRYHYHATLDYPYTLGCFRGTPAAFAWHNGSPEAGGRNDRNPGRGQRGRAGPPPPFRMR